MKKAAKSILCFAVALMCLLSIAGSCLPEVSAANNYEKDIFYFLKNKMGMNDASACGVLANIERESEFNPHLYGDGGTSYGICQWHNERFTALKDFCKERGYDYKELTGQLYYLKYELETFYPNTLADIKSPENNEEGAYYAGYSFCYNFERPANKGYKSEQRGNLAKEYWQKYGVMEGIKPQTLKSVGTNNTVSSAEDFTISWTAGGSGYNRNRLHIVPQYPYSVSYNWDKEITVITSLKTLRYTVEKGSLPEGDYLVWVEPWHTLKNMAGTGSKPINLRVEDELFYELEQAPDQSYYDFSETERIDVEGWAVNSGGYGTECYVSIDGGEGVLAEKVTRKDISSAEEYSPFCKDDLVGFSMSLPLSDISNGEHTVTVTLKSQSVISTVFEGIFTVVNSHDHSFTKFVSNKDATYISDGTKTAKCDYCNTKATVPDEGTKLMLGVTSSLNAKAKDTSITLSWKKVSGATGYRVYIYDSGWKAIKTTSDLSYTVTDLSPSKKYKFAVKAYGKAEGEYYWADKYVTVSEYTTPSLVSSLSYTPDEKSVTLKWKSAKGAGGYRVYRYDAVNKKWDTVIKATAKTSATVKGLSQNKKYIFAVRPYYNTGNGIVWAYSYSKITAYTKLAVPVVKAAHSSAAGRVTMTWGASSGATGYQVWYGSSENGEYKKYSNFTVRSTYLYDFKRGATRYFKVRAYKKVGSDYIYSNFTDPVAVKIK